jgi:CRP-like cAMP-binding protein
MSEEELWRRYEGYAGFDSGRRFGFLQDLAEPEIQQLLTHFDPVEYGRGDVVIQEGDLSPGMFCLLDGQAEVRTGAPGRERIVEILHAGDVFGEMGFIAKMKRSASIAIREPSQVLVLSEPEFRRFAKAHPELAVKLLIRLFTIVVERFHFRIGSPTVTG